MNVLASNMQENEVKILTAISFSMICFSYFAVRYLTSTWASFLFSRLLLLSDNLHLKDKTDSEGENEGR